MSDSSASPISSDEHRRIGHEGVDLLFEAYSRLGANLHVLIDKPEETATSTLRALWLLAAGHRVSAISAIPTPLVALDVVQRARFSQLLEKRLAGVPLAYLTARQSFMGIEMVAGPGALIPRKETEIVGRAAVRLARKIAHEHGEVRVMDVCTGSGNLAAAIAVAEPRATLYASDLSEAALSLATRNFEHLHVAERIRLRQGDLFAPFDTHEFVASIDIITCNPPYISSSRLAGMPAEIALHEPRQAFDGGPIGIGILQRLIRDAPSLLRPGGWLVFEVGQGQGASVGRRMMKSGAFSVVDALADEHGQVRGLVSQVPAQLSPGSLSTPRSSQGLM